MTWASAAVSHRPQGLSLGSPASCPEPGAAVWVAAGDSSWAPLEGPRPSLPPGPGPASGVGTGAVPDRPSEPLLVLSDPCHFVGIGVPTCEMGPVPTCPQWPVGKPGWERDLPPPESQSDTAGTRLHLLSPEGTLRAAGPRGVALILCPSRLMALEPPVRATVTARPGQLLGQSWGGCWVRASGDRGGCGPPLPAPCHHVTVTVDAPRVPPSK